MRRVQDAIENQPHYETGHFNASLVNKILLRTNEKDKWQDEKGFVFRQNEKGT